MKNTNRPEEVTWTALQQATNTQILTTIFERNQQRIAAKLFFRHIPAEVSQDIIARVFANIWQERKKITTNLSVDTYVIRLIASYAREYIEEHILWWYAELDKKELLRPGSKQITIELVFEDGK